MYNFTSKKNSIAAIPFLRRLIDITTPNRPNSDDNRVELRYNRTLPLVICPAADDGSPDLEDSLLAISQDFSDAGIATISMEPVVEGEYFITVWPDDAQMQEPLHFRCQQTNCRSIALGIWSAGFSVLEVMNVENRKQVKALTQIAVRALRPQLEPV